MSTLKQIDSNLNNTINNNKNNQFERKENNIIKNDINLNLKENNNLENKIYKYENDIKNNDLKDFDSKSDFILGNIKLVKKEIESLSKPISEHIEV